MPHFTAEAKHAILLEYSPRSPAHSFAVLAQRHSIAGGSRTVSRWHARWRGTAVLLKEKARSGRPRTLLLGSLTEMLVDYILSTLGQETAALDNPPLTLVLDRARIHNLDRVREAFNERGGHVVYYELMPAMAAKRISPLDDALFHE